MVPAERRSDRPVRDKTGELEALEQARARLEAGLSRDENWRALHQAARRRGGHARPAQRCAMPGWSGRSRAIRCTGLEPRQRRHRGPAPSRPERWRRALSRCRRRAAAGRRVSGPPDDLAAVRGSVPLWPAASPSWHRRISARSPPAHRPTYAPSREALGIGRDISRQNWIEQAALLALRALRPNRRRGRRRRRKRARAVGLPDIARPDSQQRAAPFSPRDGEPGDARERARPAAAAAAPAPGDASLMRTPPVAERRAFAPASRPTSSGRGQAAPPTGLQRLEQELRDCAETTRRPEGRAAPRRS